MKTQEEYAREIDEIVRRDVESCQIDWFKIDKEIFMLPENKNKTFILGTRKTGCDLLILGGTNCDESYLDGVFGCLGNEKFYVCQPISLYETTRNIQERPALYAFKIATEYFRAHGMVPVFEKIPKITDKRGMSWNQPYRRYIEIDEEYALMTKQTFEGLREYSLTIPSGKYEGKMWKANRGGTWYLYWYDHDDNPEMIKIERREILLLN